MWEWACCLYGHDVSAMYAARCRKPQEDLLALTTQQVSCPDSERYPFLKELIALDKQLHENWEVYDHYVLEANGTGNLVSSTDKDGRDEGGSSEDGAAEDESSEGSSEDSPENAPTDTEATKEPVEPADPATSAKATKTTKTTMRTRR